MKKINYSKFAASTIASITILGLASLTAQAQTLTLLPDQGPFWHPLSPNGGTYVYANSFASPGSGLATSMGTWLNTLTEDPNTAVTFEILGSVSGNPADGPDTSDVLAETAPISGISGGLALYSGAALAGGTALIAGDEYWFAATVVGAGGTGAYQFGAHTLGSAGTDDNGSFWFSNDPAGVNFDGANLQPEIAFTVTVAGTVPDGGTTATLLGGAVMAMAWLRRKITS
jgi:hypothetical protein